MFFELQDVSLSINSFYSFQISNEILPKNGNWQFKVNFEQ